jgi:hypothetical protein
VPTDNIACNGKVFNVFYERIFRAKPMNGNLLAIPFFFVVFYSDGYFYKLFMPGGKIGITAGVSSRRFIVLFIFAFDS